MPLGLQSCPLTSPPPSWLTWRFLSCSSISHGSLVPSEYSRAPPAAPQLSGRPFLPHCLPGELSDLQNLPELFLPLDHSPSTRLLQTPIHPSTPQLQRPSSILALPPDWSVVQLSLQTFKGQLHPQVTGQPTPAPNVYSSPCKYLSCSIKDASFSSLSAEAWR